MSELIDLVDQNGAIQQAGVERDAATYEGLHMQIVIALITNLEGKILVHKRSMFKRVNPGDIDHVCGGMYSAETPEDATLLDPTEVEWAQFYALDELKERQKSGEFSFVDGFFEDITIALAE